MIKRKIYDTKEIDKLAFEIIDPFIGRSIEEQVQNVKDIIINRINNDFRILQISIKEDFHVNLSKKEEAFKMLFMNKKESR